MSRNAVPSSAQVEKLLDSLDEKRFLATGHARTSHARDRTRAAWQEIALKLNSDGSGCIKSWQQWAKYWKDKKSAVKKKASHIRMARLRTGGGAGEEIFLSAIEEKIMAIMGGEGFAIGDRELEINPFNVSTDEAEPIIENINQSPNAPDTILLSIQDPSELEVTPGSESILQGHVQSLVVEHGTARLLQTEQSTPTLSAEQPGPSWRDNVPVENQPNTEHLVEATSPPPAVPHRSGHIDSASPRRRRVLAARRRVIQRSPPSQRRSQMASLTERFIAIEENRLENEKQIIENQKKMFDIFMEVSRSLSRQTNAIKELCEATKALVDRDNRNRM